MTRKQRRMWIVGLVGLGLATATVLILSALEENIAFFLSPSDVLAAETLPDRPFRLGGLVEEGSFIRVADTAMVEFRVTDTAQSVPVVYTGILPDLFREGQGVVTEGRLGPDGIFRAETVLARHDENYMPPEVADALERAGAAGYGEYGAETVIREPGT